MMKSKSVLGLHIVFALILFSPSATPSLFSQQEPASQAIDQAVQAHGNRWLGGTLSDLVGRGRISVTGDENSPMEFTLFRKGKNKVQRTIITPSGRILRCGSNGNRSWHSSGPFSGEAVGNAAHFVESQTDRSIANLFDNIPRGQIVRELVGQERRKHVPENASARAMEVHGQAGKKTIYYIDNESFLITRLEFDTGTKYTMMFNDEAQPVYASYVFSDYRNVNGVMTPFKIESYLGLVKIEEMNFDSVEYDTGITDDAFVP